MPIGARDDDVGALFLGDGRKLVRVVADRGGCEGRCRDAVPLEPADDIRKARAGRCHLFRGG